MFDALLDVRLPDDGELARVGRRWLEVACAGLAPGMWGRLQESLPLGPAREWDEPHGDPGGVWAYVSVVPRPWRGRVDTEVYSPDSFGWLLGRVAARPVQASFHLMELDERGVLDKTGGRQLIVSVKVVEDHPEWVQLQAHSGLAGVEGDPRRPEVSARWAEVLHAVASQADASFGHLCDDAGYPGDTALDDTVFRGGTVVSIMAGREVLRGYSWVTVCPGELAGRLGGAGALAASGAFWKAEELPHGAVWLQASEHFAGYDEAAMRRVFEVLAPVLPRGQPEPDPFAAATGRTYRLVWEDAARYQPAAPEPVPVRPVRWPEPRPLLVAGEAAAAVGPGAGTVTRAGEGEYELRFDRRFHRDCAALWRMLTDPAIVVSWLGRIPAELRQPEYVIEPFVGGRVRLGYLDSTEHGGPLSSPVFALKKVVAAQEPMLLEYASAGPDGRDVHTRWQLQPDNDDGCRVLFSYAFQMPDRLPKLLADWHCRLDAIALVLDGHAPGNAWERWSERYETYLSVIQTEH